MKKFTSKKVTRFVALFLISILVMSTIPVSADNSNTLNQIKKAEYSETYKQYLNDAKNGRTEKYNGIIPNPYQLEGTQIQSKGRTAPTSYDPRKLGLMTSIKNQEDLGICWDFAAMATLESFLKLNNYGDYDLSEEHLRWWASDGEYGWSVDDMNGALNYEAMGYLTSWSGPKLEKDIPYNGRVSKAQGAKKPTNMNTAPTVFNVTDAVCVSNDINSTKNAILQYGAVTSGYYEDIKYQSDDQNSYYCPTKSFNTNHAISIVGWDDNYSKDNFNANIRPSKNGAWLIKNSWGDYNSEGGYFWISYEDKTLMSDIDNFSIKGGKKPNDDEKMYQHDYASIVPLISKKITAANVFDFNRGDETLKSVMFLTESIGAKYEVYYAPVVNGIPQENNMKKLKEGTAQYSGYITVPIDSFDIPEGKGAIVVSIEGKNGESTIGSESNIPGYDTFKAKANLGESYIIDNTGKFFDINRDSNFYPCNFTIKAVTEKSSGESIPNESLIGSDRYETAIKVSQNGFNSSENVVLVNGSSIVDALAATPFTSAINSPILLTQKEALNSKTKAEIQRLGAKKVYLIGGENSISKEIEQQLKSLNISIERISGSDRYKTSLLLAQKLNGIKNVSQIAVVNGVKGLADAISVGAAAAENNIPIILANEKSELQGADEFLNSLNIEKSYIIGGTASLSNNLESKLKNPTRLSGSSRDETNSKIIDNFYKKDTLKNAFVVKNGIKNQNDLIDGLAVGPLGAKTGSPVILVGDKLADSQKEVLKNKTLEKVTQVGGGANKNAFKELVKLKSAK